MSIGCLVAWVLVGFGPVVAFSPVPSQYYLTPNPNVLAGKLTETWVAKDWSLTKVKSDRNAEVLAKKKALADDAEEGDPMEVDPTNLEKLVAKSVASAVQSALKARDGPKTNTRRRAQVNGSNPSSHSYVTNSSIGKRKSPWTEEARPDLRQKRSHSQAEAWEEFKAYDRQTIPQNERTEFRTKTEATEEQVRACKWTPAKPSSLPRQILDLPRNVAISLIQSRMPISQVSRADLMVKLGPGVPSIPEKIDEILSLGHRFLFPAVFSLELPMVAYMSLARRIKWQIYYHYMKKEPSFLDQNPQFRLSKKESLAVPDTTPLWVVAMLEKGRLEMLRQLSTVPIPTANAPQILKRAAILQDCGTGENQTTFWYSSQIKT